MDRPVQNWITDTIQLSTVKALHITLVSADHSVHYYANKYRHSNAPGRTGGGGWWIKRKLRFHRHTSEVEDLRVVRPKHGRSNELNDLLRNNEMINATYPGGIQGCGIPKINAHPYQPLRVPGNNAIWRIPESILVPNRVTQEVMQLNRNSLYYRKDRASIYINFFWINWKGVPPPSTQVPSIIRSLSRSRSLYRFDPDPEGQAGAPLLQAYFAPRYPNIPSIHVFLVVAVPRIILNGSIGALRSSNFPGHRRHVPGRHSNPHPPFRVKRLAR
ncbi:unnamed protein product [Nesidiocoris tenuis]|uniref:Uncharacterized protein n=1 Tax=Nesidiocoris tenuis TaxID=355587 RepID=A0A6H5G9Z9_9HEMI|nr:unnamed protein product [Nesidiocoris tenuis]